MLYRIVIFSTNLILKYRLLRYFCRLSYPFINNSLLKNVDFFYSSCGLKDLHKDLFIENTSKNPLNFLIYGFYEVFKKFNYISIFSSIFKGKINIDIGIDDKATKN